MTTTDRRRARRRSARRGGSRPASRWRRWPSYLPELPETTALVLIEKREIPARNAVVKAASAPTGASQAVWPAQRRCAGALDPGAGQGRARRIRAPAAQALAEMEIDPRTLGNEITKLLTYVNFARPVELEDVQTLTPAGGEAKVFDMVDAIGQRRGPAAQRELHKPVGKRRTAVCAEHDRPPVPAAAAGARAAQRARQRGRNLQNAGAAPVSDRQDLRAGAQLQSAKTWSSIYRRFWNTMLRLNLGASRPNRARQLVGALTAA